MHTIKIVSTLQPNKDTVDGKTYTIEKGVNDVPVAFWIGYKSKHKNHIAGRHIFPEDKSAEESAIAVFISSCFSEFESLVVSSVRDSSEKGALSKGVKHSLALEWLASKSESRDSRREEREEESLSISRKAFLISEEANKLARRAIAWAAIATLIATIAIAVK